jgi:8-oxo-dGTP pyrophosphatase MutT (NUDIX family)
MRSQLPRPAVTVATIVERDGTYLMVEETTRAGLRLNQPAGHLEPGETIVAAAVRETLEETGYHVRPTALVGIYRWLAPGTGITYVRHGYPDDRQLSIATGAGSRCVWNAVELFSGEWFV